MKPSHLALSAVLSLALVACGDSSSETTTTTPTPTPTPTSTPPPAPTRSQEAMVELMGDFECLDFFCDFARFELGVTNTGGVGANINFIRIENRNAQPILELGADHFVNNLGTNRVEAGGRLDFTLDAQLGFVVIIGYRDDRGNAGEAKYFPDLPR